MLDKEIIDGFKEETNQLVKELNTCVERLETATDKFPTGDLEEFAQKIDRVMGAAKTLHELEPNHKGFITLGKLGEICKKTGYNAAKTDNIRLIPIFAAFWADTLEIIGDVMDEIEDVDSAPSIVKEFFPVLEKRLKWLADKVNDMQAKSTKGSGAADNQIAVDDLLKSLGI